MKVVAKRTYIRMSPRKLRLVADLIRGQKMSVVLPQLAFLHQEAADPMLKVVKQAAANARQLGASGDLRITKVLVDQGPILKRWQPVSRGRAHSIKKYTSHILVEVEPVVNLSELQATSSAKKVRQTETKAENTPTAKETKAESIQSKKKSETKPVKKSSKPAASKESQLQTTAKKTRKRTTQAKSTKK